MNSELAVILLEGVGNYDYGPEVGRMEDEIGVASFNITKF
jgi:hypothetical protein